MMFWVIHQLLFFAFPSLRNGRCHYQAIWLQNQLEPHNLPKKRQHLILHHRKLHQRNVVCENLKKPGGANLSIISPNVTTFFILVLVVSLTYTETI